MKVGWWERRDVCESWIVTNGYSKIFSAMPIIMYNVNCVSLRMLNGAMMVYSALNPTLVQLPAWPFHLTLATSSQSAMMALHAAWTWRRLCLMR